MKFAVLTKDHSLFELVESCCKNEAQSSVQFRDEVALLRALRATPYDLILIDLDMQSARTPSLLNWRSCRGGRHVPVIVIGDFRDRESMERVIAAGADDFATRPIDPAELPARARMLLKRLRAPETSSDRISLGQYTLDRTAGTIEFDDTSVHLTPRELSITWLFFSNPGTFLTHQQISESVWSCGADIVRRTIEQHVYKVRKKLDLNGQRGLNLRAVYSQGYKLEVSADVSMSARQAAAEQADLLQFDDETGMPPLGMNPGFNGSLNQSTLAF